MTDEKLIEQARVWAALIGTEPRGARDLFTRLADAFEARDVKNRPAQMSDREALIEEAAKAMAILDDYDGCFERLAAWRNATGDQRESGEVEEPLSFDDEDAEFWLKRAHAALAVFEKSQAEPTNAQVDAALTAAEDAGPLTPIRERLRAALRAAFAVRNEP